MFAIQLSLKGPASTEGRYLPIHRAVSKRGLILCINNITKNMGIHVIVFATARITVVLFMELYGPSIKEGTLSKEDGKNQICYLLS